MARGILGPLKPLKAHDAFEQDRKLRPTLSWPHLIALGIGAIVGTGIYTLTGVGADRAGPAVIVAFAIAGFYKSQYINASFGGVRLGNNQLFSKLSMWSLMWINVTNLLGIVFTLGVYYPWAKIRLLRYQLENIHVDSDGRVAELQAGEARSAGALGEEASDFFNVDLGI